MDKKIIICAGGTGGHMFPAQAFAIELKEKYQLDLKFIGGGLDQNKYFEKSQFDYHSISSATLSLRQYKLWLKSSYQIIKGIFQSIKILKKNRPVALVAFGSFYTFPTLVAAFLLKIPIYLHEQNKQMGKVNRWFTRFSKLTAVSFPQTFPNIKNKNILVQMPLKFKRGQEKSLIQMRQKYGLKPDLKTILICGGSQGAQSINEHFLKALPLLKNQVFQVIHIIGFSSCIDKIKSCYQELNIHALVEPFNINLHELMIASDFLIGRAGASTVFEILELELPALLIPYPYAHGHQELNANFIVQEALGGMKLSENQLSDSVLAQLILHFLDSNHTDQYRRHMQEYKKVTPYNSLSYLISKQVGLHEKK